MMSSLGYHTMELSLRLTAYEAKQLIQIFEKNRELYFKDNNNRGVASHQYHSSSRYYYIQYRQKYNILFPPSITPFVIAKATKGLVGH